MQPSRTAMQHLHNLSYAKISRRNVNHASLHEGVLPYCKGSHTTLVG
jgi:hypothetical protein